jgi:hypothetical protein
VQIDGCLIQPLIAGRHGGDLMVADPIGRSQADRKYRRARSRGSGGILTSIAAVGQQDDARDLLTAIALANRGERPAQVAPAPVAAQPIEACGLDALSDRVELGRELA